MLCRTSTSINISNSSSKISWKSSIFWWNPVRSLDSLWNQKSRFYSQLSIRCRFLRPRWLWCLRVEWGSGRPFLHYCLLRWRQQVGGDFQIDLLRRYVPATNPVLSPTEAWNRSVNSPLTQALWPAWAIPKWRAPFLCEAWPAGCARPSATTPSELITVWRPGSGSPGLCQV